MVALLSQSGRYLLPNYHDIVIKSLSTNICDIVLSHPNFYVEQNHNLQNRIFNVYKNPLWVRRYMNSSFLQPYNNSDELAGD